jgi:hypothetical protein
MRGFEFHQSVLDAYKRFSLMLTHQKKSSDFPFFFYPLYYRQLTLSPNPVIGFRSFCSCTVDIEGPDGDAIV